MDKSRKLRRYNRKDYTEVVDFPVEIVGRDGVVRRYSFEESVRLYQRRIASAQARYGDLEVADAEMEHCRRRIAQLRVSYFERYGDEGLRLLDDPARPGLAGEVTAFLRRCLDGDAAMDRIHVELAGTIDGGTAFGVQLGPDGPALLLYRYLFEAPGVELPSDPSAGASLPREAFFAQVKALQAMRGEAEGLETLVGYHHGADLGLVLTSSAEVAREFAYEDVGELGAAPWEAEDLSSSDAHQDGAQKLRAGDLEGALAAFSRACDQDPWRKGATLGAVVLADQLGRFEEAAMTARMGVHYFPDDPGLAWHLAAAHLRLGEHQQAREALVRAQAFDGHPQALVFLRALLALSEGRMRAGRRLLVELARNERQVDPELLPARRRIRAALALFTIGRLTALLAALVGARVMVAGYWAGGLGLALGAVLFLASRPIWRAWFRGLLSRPGREGITLASGATLLASGLRVERARPPRPSGQGAE